MVRQPAGQPGTPAWRALHAAAAVHDTCWAVRRRPRSQRSAGPGRADCSRARRARREGRGPCPPLPACAGDRPSGSQSGGSVQLLQQEVQPQDGAHAGRSDGERSRGGGAGPGRAGRGGAAQRCGGAGGWRDACVAGSGCPPPPHTQRAWWAFNTAGTAAQPPLPPRRAPRSCRGWSLCMRAASSTGTSSQTTSSWAWARRPTRCGGGGGQAARRERPGRHQGRPWHAASPRRLGALQRPHESAGSCCWWGCTAC